MDTLNFWKKNRFWREAFLVAILLLVASGVRFYHFGDWLHFELDQSRDALVVDKALEGSFLDLPLLGPKAGGTFLRLGPAYYYIQYASATVFGSLPSSQVMFVPLLGVLLVLAFYYFSKMAFTRFIAFGGAIAVASSLYAILYSRFGWNPNLLPFFTLTGFWALLVALEKNSFHNINPIFWLSVFLLGLATQMHFLAFLAVPTILAPFLLMVRPRFSWKSWVGAILIGGALYIPMVLNETKTGFANTKEFFGAITEKSNKEQHPFLEKLIRNTTEYGLAEVVVLSGYEGATQPKINTSGMAITSFVCDSKCDQGKWWGVIGIGVFLLSLLAFVEGFWQAKEEKEKRFFLLLLLWQVVSFVLFTPLSYGIAPRFYLLTLPLFFLGLMSIFAILLRRYKTLSSFLFCLVVVTLVASNGRFLVNRFQELQMAVQEPVESAPDRILKERHRVTLEQQQKIVSFILSLPQIREWPLYFESTPQYKRAFKYLLSKQGILTDGISKENIYREGVFVYVFPTRKDTTEALGEFTRAYSVKEERSFGTLTAVVLIPKEEHVTVMREIKTIAPTVAPPNLAPKRYTWREFFTGASGEALDSEEGSEGEGSE